MQFSPLPSDLRVFCRAVRLSRPVEPDRDKLSGLPDGARLWVTGRLHPPYQTGTGGSSFFLSSPAARQTRKDKNKEDEKMKKDDILGFVMIFSFLIGSAGAECMPLFAIGYGISAVIAGYFWVKEGKKNA